MQLYYKISSVYGCFIWTKMSPRLEVLRQNDKSEVEMLNPDGGTAYASDFAGAFHIQPDEFITRNYYDCKPWGAVAVFHTIKYPTNYLWK